MLVYTSLVLSVPDLTDVQDIVVTLCLDDDEQRDPCIPTYSPTVE